MAGSGGFNQPRARIHPGEFPDFRCEQRPNQHALAAANVNDRFTWPGIENPEGGGKDDMLMVIRAGLTDEFVIPRGDRIPAAITGDWLI